ncbi:LOW QUALITY PROTEIN: prestin-like [Pecten maximus]|uniref:LOW QUALITY PROTEIN: prestin-like n=1 Tax=Pecten maximus TaxID=6579 RepID=UPI001458D986|nr:LOW QUALITY PROTEIN: prestin-like [Pecten maximus]
MSITVKWPLHLEHVIRHHRPVRCRFPIQKHLSRMQRSVSVAEGMPMEPGTNGRNNRRSSCPPVSGQESTVFVKRPPYTQVAFDNLNLREDVPSSTTLGQKLRNKCDCSAKCVFKQLSAFLPIIKVLRYYNFKENLLIDILSGITIGILHIPQALAFGLLTSVKVENGLYTSVWPVILYVFFGTSAHVSMGTSAVICIVTASVVDRQAEAFKEMNMHLMVGGGGNGTSNSTIEVWEDIPEFMDFKENVAINVALSAGLIMMLMGLFRLGFVTAYLSESFFSAFTSGAAVHIATSQIPALLGIKTPRFGGVFKIIYTYEAIFGKITEMQPTTPIIAVISIAILFLVKECINERFKHKLFIPIPVELLVVILATVLSFAIGFDEEAVPDKDKTFHVAVVGQLTSSFPMPVFPDLTGIQNYIVDSFVIAILIFANTIAMAKICAKKHNYQIDDSQELIAYGMCNFLSAFMLCFPSAVAPPRSMVASSMNTKTTFTGVFVTILMLLVILVISALFKPLPKAALAAIIVVALKGLFVQMLDCRKFWRVNKFDFIIWFFTIFSVVFLDIDLGLGIGVVVSLVTVVFQTQFSRGYRLAVTSNEGIMVENNKYKNTREVPGVKIFRFQSNLYFANAEIFRNTLYSRTVNPRIYLKMLKKQQKRDEKSGDVEKNGNLTSSYVKPTDGKMKQELPSISLDSNGKDLRQKKESVVSTISNTSADNPAFCVSEENLVPQEGHGKFNGNNGTPSHNFLTISNYPLSSRRFSVASSISMITELEIDPADGDAVVSVEWLERAKKTHHIIIDCSTMNYLDISGASVLSHIYAEYQHVNITVFLAGCSADIRNTMQHAGVFDKIPKDNFFIDLEDAISIAKNMAVQTIPINLEDFSDDEAAENSYVTRM